MTGYGAVEEGLAAASPPDAAKTPPAKTHAYKVTASRVLAAVGILSLGFAAGAGARGVATTTALWNPFNPIPIPIPPIPTPIPPLPIPIPDPLPGPIPGVNDDNTIPGIPDNIPIPYVNDDPTKDDPWKDDPPFPPEDDPEEFFCEQSGFTEQECNSYSCCDWDDDDDACWYDAKSCEDDPEDDNLDCLDTPPIGWTLSSNATNATNSSGGDTTYSDWVLVKQKDDSTCQLCPPNDPCLDGDCVVDATCAPVWAREYGQASGIRFSEKCIYVFPTDECWTPLPGQAPDCELDDTTCPDGSEA